MSSSIIQANYDELDRVAAQFGNEAQAIAEMLQHVRQHFDILVDGGWVGRGSEAFKSEMEQEVLPAVQRLINALEEAQSATNKISNIIDGAEEEAGSPFRNGGSAGGGFGSAISGGRAFDIGGIAGGSGGVWSNGGFNPIGGQIDAVRDLARDMGLFPSGGGAGGDFSGIFTGGGSGNDYGIPHDWLDGVTGGLGDHTNDYGIPRDWLDGVTGGNPQSDWGIPRDWLDGVTDQFDGTRGAGEGLTMGGLEQAAAGGSGGGSGSGGGPSGGGASGGAAGGSEADISGPGSTPRDFRGSFGTVIAAGSQGGAAEGGLRYQPIIGLGGGGAAPSSAPAQALAQVASGGGGGAAPAAAATPAMSNSAIPIGIAAASPFVALLGKAIKSQFDDRD